MAVARTYCKACGGEGWLPSRPTGQSACEMCGGCGLVVVSAIRFELTTAGEAALDGVSRSQARRLGLAARRLAAEYCECPPRVEAGAIERSWPMLNPGTGRCIACGNRRRP